MRLWHKDLLPYLDNNRIVAQWRELLAIKGTIDKHGTPKSSIVNKVLDYPITHFKCYTMLVCSEMDKRGIKYNMSKLVEVLDWWCTKFKCEDSNLPENLFKDWHNNRYLQQCYFNLQEKYDCGAVPQENFDLIETYVENYFLTVNKLRGNWNAT